MLTRCFRAARRTSRKIPSIRLGEAGVGDVGVGERKHDVVFRNSICFGGVVELCLGSAELYGVSWSCFGVRRK